jgi:hypothetical protein
MEKFLELKKEEKLKMGYVILGKNDKLALEFLDLEDLVELNKAIVKEIERKKLDQLNYEEVEYFHESQNAAPNPTESKDLEKETEKETEEKTEN